MGCSHTEECPLFPLLSDSLRSWRDCYCDSDDGWRKCERYKLSLTGRRVPISLLPNGFTPAHLGGGVDTGGCGSSGARDGEGVTQVVLAPPAAAVAVEPEVAVVAVPVPRPRPAPPDPVVRRVRRPGRVRLMWSRLLDWMRSPA